MERIFVSVNTDSNPRRQRTSLGLRLLYGLPEEVGLKGQGGHHNEMKCSRQQSGGEKGNVGLTESGRAHQNSVSLLENTL